MEINNQATKIKAKEKLSFGLATLGNIPIMIIISTFLLFFYTNIVGLNPAAVATLFLISRFFDAFVDPLLGYYIDRLPRTKMGRFRMCLMVGAIICSINFMLLWFGPMWATAGQLVIAYVTYLLMGITFTIMDIPLNSLIPVMTDDQKERASLSGIRGLFSMLGAMLISMIAPIILTVIPDQVSAFYILIFGAIAIILICSLVGVAGVKERIVPTGKVKKYGIKEFFTFLKSGPVFITFFATVLFGTSTAVAGASNLFFFTYVIGNVAMMSLVGLFSLVGLIPAIAVSAPLTNRFGKKKMFVAGLFINGITTLIRILGITSIPLLIVSVTISGIGTGFITALMHNIQADNVDFIDYKFKFRAEGAIASLSSFAVKTGQAIGGALPGYILAITGYVPGAVQTDLATTGIVLSTIVLPAVAMVIAVVIFGLGYKLDGKQIFEISQTLRERRQES